MSAEYQLLRAALLARQSCFAFYDNYERLFCPHILGLKDGVEQVLCWQYAGGSSQGLPPGGQWKCLTISKMAGLKVTTDPWHYGEPGRTGRPSHCVDLNTVDVEVPL
jgi:hypothetical protein